MKKTLKRATCLVCMVVALGTGAAWGQLGGLGGLLGLFGGGIPVIDISAAVNWATQLVQMVQAVTTAKEHLKQFVQQAKYLRNQVRYATQVTPWRQFVSSDTFGWNAAWITAANAGTTPQTAWDRAGLPTVLFASSLLPAAQAQRAEKQMATLELMNGTGITTLDTVGRVRANGPDMDNKILTLQRDALSDDEDMNTEAAQLNKANAIALAHLKAVADANKLATVNAEIALAQLKLQHDAMAAALEAEAALRTNGPALLTAQHSRASDQMLAYRIQ